MKTASFGVGATASYGIVTDKGIIDAGRRLKNFPTLKSLLTQLRSSRRRGLSFKHAV